jgi:hypothetical protein
VLAAALAWQRRRTAQRRRQQQSTPRATEEEPVSLDSLADAPAGEAYDSVNTEDAVAEWLLRATEARPPTPDPERRRDEAVLAEAASGDGEREDTAFPDGYFDSAESEGKSRG